MKPAKKRFTRPKSAPTLLMAAKEWQAPAKVEPISRVCGRCGARASYGVAYPGPRDTIPPHRRGKKLHACEAHFAQAMEAVAGWCRQDGDAGWADALDRLRVDWEARRTPT